MTAQLSKGRQDHQLSRARQHRFMFQRPGMLVRNVDGVEPDFHRWIDVAASAVADDPAVGLPDFVFVNESAIRLRILFRDVFYKFKTSLQPGSLDFRRLFRGLALRK